MGAMLFGREAERARIAALLDDARLGQSGVLVLRGEAGVGKSALLEAARDLADGMTVLGGCGIESEARLPYSGLHQIVRPILPALDRLPEPQARALRGALGLGTGTGDQWFLVSLAALSLLSEAAEEGPLLCLVDDAHWLDDASAESLVFAARRLEAEGIAMLFAAREGEVRSFEAPGLDELRLDGLDPVAAAAMLDEHAEVVLSPEARARLIEGTNGNPLALLELFSTLSETQLTGAEPLADPLPVGRRIERAFLSRARELPEGTQTLLLVASADDSGSPAPVLAAAARLGADADALDAAEEAGLLTVRGGTLAFRHPLIRSAIYQSAPFSRRRAAHRALADVLEGEAEADRRAWHRAAASVEPDASVAEELERAARRARRRSGFVSASLAYERAATLTLDDHAKARLLSSAAESAWYSGRIERALMLLERARPSVTDPAERAGVDRWRGQIELGMGMPTDARDLLVRSATEIASVDASRALYTLGLACIASAYGGDGDAIPGIALAGAELRVSDDSAVTRFLQSFLEGTGSYFAAEFETAAPMLREAVEAADDADVEASAQLPDLLLLAGGAALFLGDDSAAERFNRRLATLARDLGALSLLNEILPRVALGQVSSGQWQAAAAGLTEGLELARQTGQQQLVGHMLAMLAFVAGLRGDEEECRALAAESIELAAPRNLVHVSLTARWALLCLELGHGRADEALAAAREITAIPLTLWGAPDRIEAAYRADDVEAARAWLAPFEDWARSSGSSWGCDVATRCRAVLAEDSEEADRLFAHALGRADGRPFERARTEFAFGEHLRRTRRRVEAREHLRAALDGFETLGARLWAERARVELRASGQTARRREPSTRGDLTPQELQIARFVGQGLSNREVAAQMFLSPRTIDFHLRNVFRKLEITSRMQLAQLDLVAAAEPRSEVAAAATASA
jgi:DNA-binding CsgD family transcriptional regulator